MKSLQQSLDGEMGGIYGSLVGGQFFEDESEVGDLPSFEEEENDDFSPSRLISNVGFNPQISDFRPGPGPGFERKIEDIGEDIDEGEGPINHRERQSQFVLGSALFGALTIVSGMIFI